MPRAFLAPFPAPPPQICDEHGVYKLETIGDAYLASTGCIPRSRASPQEDALKTARLALSLQAHCEK